MQPIQSRDTNMSSIVLQWNMFVCSVLKAFTDEHKHASCSNAVPDPCSRAAEFCTQGSPRSCTVELQILNLLPMGPRWWRTKSVSHISLSSSLWWWRRWGLAAIVPSTLILLWLLLGAQQTPLLMWWLLDFLLKAVVQAAVHTLCIKLGGGPCESQLQGAGELGCICIFPSTQSMQQCRHGSS